jgi:hypothetical protein
MKDTPLRKEFETIAAQLENGGELATVVKGLRQMQAAVRALQEEGFSAALDIRPYGFNCPLQHAGQIICNGTMRIDDIGVDFMIVRNERAALLMLPFLGQVQVGTFYVNGEAEELRPAVSTLLLQVKAHTEAMTAGNAPASGVATLASAKFTPKLRPGG